MELDIEEDQRPFTYLIALPALPTDTLADFNGTNIRDHIVVGGITRDRLFKEAIRGSKQTHWFPVKLYDVYLVQSDDDVDVSHLNIFYAKLRCVGMGYPKVDSRNYDVVVANIEGRWFFSERSKQLVFRFFLTGTKLLGRRRKRSDYESEWQLYTDEERDRIRSLDDEDDRGCEIPF